MIVTASIIGKQENIKIGSFNNELGKLTKGMTSFIFKIPEHLITQELMNDGATGKTLFIVIDLSSEQVCS